MAVGNSLWFGMIGPGRAAFTLRIPFSCSMPVGEVERGRRVVGVV